MLLEQWDAEATEQAQSIISGADLPHDKEKLSVYCPHVQRNAQLDTLWRIQSTVRYYDFKTNNVILAHLKAHKIYMNPTEIKQIEVVVAGFFVYLHIKYHSRKDAAVEIAVRAMIDGFDLHVHTCRHMQKRHTKAIAILCGCQSARETRSKLYKMNTQKVSEKATFPHTQHWIFVPFKVDGSITKQHIALMIRKQNIYLCDETTISVTGLCQINSIITVPGTAT
eukprot:11115247-Ditylum_brightwellii.AAC.1